MPRSFTFWPPRLALPGLVANSLASKIAWAAAIVVLIVIPIVGVIPVQIVQQSMQKIFLSQAMASARFFESSILDSRAFKDRHYLFELMQKNIWLEPSLQRIVILRNDPDTPPHAYLSSDGSQLEASLKPLHQTVISQRRPAKAYHEDGEHRILRVVTPVHAAQNVIGTIEMAFYLDQVEDSMKAMIMQMVWAYVAIAVLVPVILWWLLHWLVVRPITTISGGIKKVASGNRKIRLDFDKHDEIGQLGQAFDIMVRDLNLAEHQIRQMACHDHLTGLPNRRHLIQGLNQFLGNSETLSEYPAALLLYIDVDDFKQVNDTYGHAFGDGFLVELSRRLQRVVQKDEITARIGGDEFLVFLLITEDTFGSRTQARCDEVFDFLNGPYVVENLTINPTVSIGVRIIERGRSTPDDVIGEADEALYQAKRRGKNQIIYYAKQPEDS